MPSHESSMPAHDDVDRARERKQAEAQKQEQARLVAQQQAADLAAAQAQQAQQQDQMQARRERVQGQQHEGAEAIAQAQERMIDLDARASTARRQVGQIRKQQEAEGLGLRNDVESAESRLQTYLHAAKADIDRGDAIAARQDLNKAEPELNTLERFLGH